MKVLTEKTEFEKELEKTQSIYKMLAAPSLRQRVPVPEWHATFKVANEYVAFLYDNAVRSEIRRLRRAGLVPPNVGMVLRLAFNKLIIPRLHLWEVEKPGIEGVKEILAQVENLINYYLEHPDELVNVVKSLVSNWYAGAAPAEEYARVLLDALRKIREKLPQLREEYIAYLKMRGILG